MPSYGYVAVNRLGKRVKDNIDASSLENAKNSLRAAGYSIIEIKELGVLDKDINLPFLGNPTAKDMAIFCRQFQSILRAGVPVVQVLVMLGQQTKIQALAGDARDEATFRFSPNPNPAYKLSRKVAGGGNWTKEKE